METNWTHEGHYRVTWYAQGVRPSVMHVAAIVNNEPVRWLWKRDGSHLKGGAQ